MNNEQSDIALLFDEIKDVVHRWEFLKAIDEKISSDLLTWIQEKYIQVTNDT